MDEWEIVPFLQKLKHPLSFSDWFAQHNESRVPIIRIIGLSLGHLTHYNTIGGMVFSWILINLSGATLFYMYRKKLPQIRFSKALLLFFPVSLLLFSFRQYSSILFGSAYAFFFTIFLVIITFSLLEETKKMFIRIFICSIPAIIASFSFIFGLLVWPAGLFHILFSKNKRKVQEAFLWSFFGVIVGITYFYGYVTPSHHPSLSYISKNPIISGGYFLTLLGSPISFSGIHFVTALSFGIVLLGITGILILQLHKDHLLRENRIWLSITLFVALSLAATTIGRSGFGIEHALTSRYTPVTILGIISIYFMALSISEKHHFKGKSYGLHALVILIVVGLIMSYGAGWQVGRYTKLSREMGAYILTTYDIQSDDNIRTYLYPNPISVRERAVFLEENRLNVFYEKRIDLSILPPIYSDTLSTIDTINGVEVSEKSLYVVINSSQYETITITGWAVDTNVNEVASTVFITIDDRIDIPTLYGLDRTELRLIIQDGSKIDMSTYYELDTLNISDHLRYSGYVATFSTSILSKGAHTLSLKIVAADATGYYHPPQKVNFIIE
jgi:hypothetical protein